MPITLKNKNDHKLAQAALNAVHQYNADKSFEPERHYTIQLPQGRLKRLHGGGRADVYLLIYQNKRYCLKWFHDSRLISRLRNSLNHSKALQSYKTSNKLQTLRINAPRVLGVIQPGLFASPLLIMEMLEECMQLNLLLEKWKTHSADLSTKPHFSQLAQQFGTFTKELHSNKILHRDFSPRNVLVRQINSNFEFYLIDLEDICFGTENTNNLQHFNERLPRYLSPTECSFFIEQFQTTYL